MTEQNAPVVGVIVDNDHDGEPDVFEHSTALVERPDYEPVPVQPASAGLVTPAEEQALAWRRVVETRPVVPPWMSDREQRALAIRWAGRYFWHRVKFHAFHSPLYGWRLVCRSPRGLKRTLVWWCRWAFDQETRPLRQALVDAGDGSGYHRLR
jgi:S-DNA-T family DNA segregation ATPase FtsK/SpoIIIE